MISSPEVESLQSLTNNPIVSTSGASSPSVISYNLPMVLSFCILFRCAKVIFPDDSAIFRIATCMMRSSSEMQSWMLVWAMPRHFPQNTYPHRLQVATGASSDDAVPSTKFGTSWPNSSHLGQNAMPSKVSKICCVFRRSHRSYSWGSKTRSSMREPSSALQSGTGHLSSMMLPSLTCNFVMSPMHSTQKLWAQPPRFTNKLPAFSPKQMPHWCTSFFQHSNSLLWS
mmetsp:Transcript_95369/g.309009  ORF Transcript_95369/g.309009 Transcript_95369/m.309009 type:complete len:227 (+) Transcript_95369:745-1425(+)